MSSEAETSAIPAPQDSANPETEVEEVEQAASTHKSYPPIILHVLPLIKDTQRQHGLRHNDFLRYRQYCSRRLSRMRHCLKFTNGKTKFVPKVIEPDLAIKDVRYYQIILFEAERAWSYSMQLKQQAAIEHRHAFHSLARLRKAVMHATEFADLVTKTNITDARSQLEITAYVAWMKASLEFELQNWQQATVLFGQSKIIYEKLHDIGGELQKPLYAQRVEEINANLRYCAHSLGGAHDVNELARSIHADAMEEIASKLDEAVQQSRKDDGSLFSEITWEGKTVGIKNIKLRRSLKQAKNIEFNLTSGETNQDVILGIYDELFVEYNDALAIINTDVQSEERASSKGTSQKNENNLQQLRFLHSYVTFLRLTKTMERNMLIVENARAALETTSASTPSTITTTATTTTRPDDIVRLYDNLLQNIADLSEVETLKDDLNFLKKIAAQTLYFKAFRCLYIGDSHRNNNKLKEAIALYDRSAVHARASIDHYQQCQVDVKNPVGELHALLDTLRGRKFAITAKSFLDSQKQSAADATATTTTYTSNKMLIDDVSHFRQTIDLKNPQILPFPPLFEPVACKPLFFDLAGHHLKFPSLEARKRKATTGLVSGFMKTFFGSK